MNGKSISEARFDDTGYSYTLSLIAGKYKPIILYCLMEYEPVRFNEMQRYLGRVADKTLSQNLKELERDGLIHEGAGAGWADPPGNVPGDPAEGGVHADAARAVSGGGAGQALRLGNGKQTRDRIKRQ